MLMQYLFLLFLVCFSQFYTYTKAIILFFMPFLHNSNPKPLIIQRALFDYYRKNCIFA